MEPGFGSIQGMVPSVMVVSVWPNPSMIRKPVNLYNSSKTEGFNASPAVQQCSSEWRSYLLKSSRIIKRYTVGGAQKEVMWKRSIMRRMSEAVNFTWS